MSERQRPAATAVSIVFDPRSAFTWPCIELYRFPISGGWMLWIGPFGIGTRP